MDQQKLNMEAGEPNPKEEIEAPESEINSVLFIKTMSKVAVEDATAELVDETISEDLVQETEELESNADRLDTLSKLSTDMILSELDEKPEKESLNGDSTNPFEEEEDPAKETAIEVEDNVLPDDTNPFSDAGENTLEVVEEIIEVPETQQLNDTNPFGDPDKDLDQDPDKDATERIAYDPPPEEADKVLATIDENQPLDNEKPEMTSNGGKSSEAGSSYQTESVVTGTKSPPTRPSSTIMNFKNLLRSGKIAALRDAEKKNGIVIRGDVPINSFSAFNSESNFLPYVPSNHPYPGLDEEPPSKLTMFLKELIIGLGVVAIVGVVVMFIGSLGKSMLR